MSAAPRLPTTPYRTVDPQSPGYCVCPGCRMELPGYATFCVQCGLCLLDITSTGTVIAMSPYVERAAAAPALATPAPVVPADTSERIVLEDEDIELHLDLMVADLVRDLDDKMTAKFSSVSAEISGTLSGDVEETLADPPVDPSLEELEIELQDVDFDAVLEPASKPRSKLERRPLTPLADWPAPPVGLTHVGPPPLPPGLGPAPSPSP